MAQSKTDDGSWKARFSCTRSEAEALSNDISPFAIGDPPPALVALEIEEDNPESWALDCYFEEQPPESALQHIRSLLPSSALEPLPKAEFIPADDWVTISQQGLKPVRAGRFVVHSSYEPVEAEAGVRAFTIDPAQAFGTGHHETTFGCLSILDALERRGQRFRNIADIGTGTGLLAFAAQHLWPRAAIVASDIDPVAVEMAERYAGENGLSLGRGKGRIALVAATGTQHALIQRRAPYDLLIANILAGPLMSLAGDFAAVIEEGGTLILAGLIERQRGDVVRAYGAQGFRLAETMKHGEWPTLRLVKRRRFGHRRSARRLAAPRQLPGDHGEW